MSWLNHLAHFAVGFAEGYVNQRGHNSRPAEAVPQSRGYDFRSHMSAIANRLDIPMQSTRETNASFRIPFGGRTYLCIAVYAGGEACIAVYSQIEFPRGGMPPDVRHLVATVSEELAEYDIDVMDDDDCSIVVTKGIVPVGNLTAQSFQYRIEQMLIIITKIDAWMLRNGFAR